MGRIVKKDLGKVLDGWWVRYEGETR